MPIPITLNRDTNMKILVIEDELKTGAFLKKGLNESGFVVDVANDGEEGLFQAQNYPYDLIILDVMLPKLNGWEVITRLHKMEKNIPVLFLTARDIVSDRVKGLELGADDYLVKPFAFSELLARVKRLLKRARPTDLDVMQIADLKIDFKSFKAYRGNKQLNLTAKEFLLLSLFVRQKGELLSRTYIAEKVWDINFDTDTNVIDVAVRRLRQKIDDPFEKKLIHTVRGLGYVFEDKI